VASPITPVACDLLIIGASELATPLGTTPRGGADLAAIRVEPGWGLAIEAGRIIDVSPDAELRSKWRARRELDAGGGTLVPGFVDAHTHPVFAATREGEFELRTRGASYAEIAAAGGGILSSVRALRSASTEQLLARLLVHLDRFLELGTTTVEAKSGYGLCAADELRSLEVIAQAAELHSVQPVPTFLGAHAVPEELRGRKADYVVLLEREMLPEVAAKGLARFCDVFAEDGFFSLDDARRILLRARELGLGARIHADQLSDFGAAELAAELGAASADHLEHAGERAIEALAGAGVVPVLCPVVPLYLRQVQEAPARRMVEAGLAPAVATDFNPGSCYLQSLPEVMSWAALRYRFSAAEALSAATLNAACSLGLGSEIGSLEVGKQADVVVLDVPNHLHLVYELGRSPVRAVVKKGWVVWKRDGGGSGAALRAEAGST
jgi:imidazolonepropionase